jgi:hypothetical protein
MHVREPFVTPGQVEVKHYALERATLGATSAFDFANRGAMRSMLLVNGETVISGINLYAPPPGKAGHLRAAIIYTEPTSTSRDLEEIFRLNK